MFTNMIFEHNDLRICYDESLDKNSTFIVAARDRNSKFDYERCSYFKGCAGCDLGEIGRLKRSNFIMVYVFNNLKYDTDKMDLISTKCMYALNIVERPVNVKLYKSLKGRWLIVFKQGGALAIDEEKAKHMLLKYDINAYEKIFGELEEA